MNRLLRSLIAAAASIATFYVVPAEADVLTLKNFGKDIADGTSPSAPLPAPFS